MDQKKRKKEKDKWKNGGGGEEVVRNGVRFGCVVEGTEAADVLIG